MCPKSFHLAWIAIVEIGSVCTFVECHEDVIRIKDPKKEAELRRRLTSITLGGDT